MKKVKANHVGTSSYLAYCQDCSWNYEKLGIDNREGQREIRKHVSKTGHTVNLEKNDVTIYSPAHE
jgi:hypothetical protein